MARLVKASVAAVAAALIVGCTTGNQITLPPPGSSPSVSQVVYVTSFNQSPQTAALITLPVTLASVPTYITPSGIDQVAQLTFDRSNDLWSVNDTASSPQATGFTRPLTGASSPFASVNIPTPSAPVGIAFDASGNLWVSDGNLNKIYEFVGPFSGTSTPTPAITLTAGLNGPGNLAFDAAGNLYVANEVTSTVLIFDAPLSNGEAPTGSPITGLNGPTALAFDASGNLYIGNFNNGSIARKNAPTAGGGAVETTDTATTMTRASGLAFDSAGNLYATDLQHPTLSVFPLATTAFSSSLAPSVTLTLTGFGTGSAGAVAVGPP